MEIIFAEGVEGPSIYLNSYRIAGPKPWGGSISNRVLKTSARDIRAALRGTEVDYDALERRYSELVEGVRKEREYEKKMAHTQNDVWDIHYKAAKLYNAARAAVDALLEDKTCES